MVKCRTLFRGGIEWDVTHNRFNVFGSCPIGSSDSTQDGRLIAHRGVQAQLDTSITETTFDSCVFHNLPGDGIEVKNSYASGTKRIVERLTVRFSKFDKIGGEGVNLYTNAYACSVYGSIFVDCDDDVNSHWKQFARPMTIAATTSTITTLHRYNCNE